MTGPSGSPEEPREADPAAVGQISAPTRSSPRIRPTGRCSSSTTSTDEPRESTNCSTTSSSVESGATITGSGRSGDVDHRVVARRDEQLEQPEVVHDPTVVVDDDHRVDVGLVLGLRAQDPAHLTDGLARMHEHDVRRHERAGGPFG